MDYKIKLKTKDSLGDSLLFASLQYFIIPTLYLIAFTLIDKYDNPYVAIWVVYTLIPISDELFELDWRNPTQKEARELEAQLKFKLPLYISVFCDWFYMFWLLDYLSLNSHRLSWINLFSTLFISGNLAGSNINVAHELFHKDDFLDKTIGTLTLARDLYMHFTIEHIFGHHRNVSTPNDPATSRKNQPIYQFLPQTVIGGFKSAWNLEVNRVKSVYKSKTGISIYNQMIWFEIFQAIFVYGIYHIYGFKIMVYFIILAVVGIFYLEAVNYIEHYGLQRKEIAKGVFEPVNIQHSWNAPHRLSNYLLFKLQRHSDHHENPYKPYQILASYPESPQLPHGYSVCVILAMIPSYWFYVMNEIVDKQEQKEKLDSEKIRKFMISFITKLSVVTTSALGVSLLI